MRNLARDLDVDLVQVAVSRECHPIEVPLPDMAEETHGRLLHFLNNWTDAESRRSFREIMEERVFR